MANIDLRFGENGLNGLNFHYLILKLVIWDK